MLGFICGGRPATLVRHISRAPLASFALSLLFADLPVDQIKVLSLSAAALASNATRECRNPSAR
jgi:hypothetical protein